MDDVVLRRAGLRGVVHDLGDLVGVYVVEGVGRRAEGAEEVGVAEEVGLAAEALEGVCDRRAREGVLVDEAAGEEDALAAAELGGVGAGEDADTGAGGGDGDAVADQEARERSILANAVQEEEAWSAGFRLRHEW